MIETYDEMMEVMDKIQLAHRYNEKSIVFKEHELSVVDAQALVDEYTKGGKRGSKK